MLDNPGEQIRACYEHAGDCARKAARQNDPTLKQDFLDAELGWLALALTYKADIPMDLIRHTPQQAAWRIGLMKETIKWRETTIESHRLLADTRASITEARREISGSRRLIEESRQL